MAKLELDPNEDFKSVVIQLLSVIAAGIAIITVPKSGTEDVIRANHDYQKQVLEKLMAAKEYMSQLEHRRSGGDS